MKSAAAVLLAAATLAVAKPQHALPTGAAINCARANANYCMGQDLILRCDGSATGTPVHCADELKNKGSPNDAVTCRQSNLEAGDGACVKGVCSFPIFCTRACRMLTFVYSASSTLPLRLTPCLPASAPALPAAPCPALLRPLARLLLRHLLLSASPSPRLPPTAAQLLLSLRPRRPSPPSPDPRPPPPAVLLPLLPPSLRLLLPYLPVLLLPTRLLAASPSSV